MAQPFLAVLLGFSDFRVRWLCHRFYNFNLAAKPTLVSNPQTFPYFIQVIIQNPTPVLINHATKVILNARENARKLSTFAFEIIASSYTWSVTFRSISSGLTFAIASKYAALFSYRATCS